MWLYFLCTCIYNIYIHNITIFYYAYRTVSSTIFIEGIFIPLGNGNKMKLRKKNTTNKQHCFIYTTKYISLAL